MDESSKTEEEDAGFASARFITEHQEEAHGYSGSHLTKCVVSRSLCLIFQGINSACFISVPAQGKHATFNKVIVTYARSERIAIEAKELSTIHYFLSTQSRETFELCPWDDEQRN